MSDKESVKESLKNSGLVAGSQVFNIVIGLVNTKVIALLLGPLGIGLIQLFTSTINLFQNVFSLGLGFSGVRDISEKFAEKDKTKMSKVIYSLDRWVIVFAIIGVFITVLFSKQISSLTFGTEKYWKDISYLSLTIIFVNLAASKSALIRGTRNMADFVRVSILSAFFAAIISIPIYYYLRESGITLVLILTSISTLIITYFYSRKIFIPKVRMSFKEVTSEGLGMVKLGMFTVITGLMSLLSLYYIRVYIADELGVDYVGYYTAATTLTVTYMELIFRALSVDYFPKLSAINKDNKLINATVLEQTKIVLLLGTPLILMMFTFSEYIIIILYSKDFILAQTLLILMLLGVFLRLIAFPTGYVFLAKNKSKIFIFTQTQWNVIFISLSLILWKYFDGLTAIGIAFVIAYTASIGINHFFLLRLTKFSYDKETIKFILLFLSITLTYFLISLFYTGTIFFIVKIFVLLLLVVYNFKMLEKLVGINILLKIKNIISKNKK